MSDQVEVGKARAAGIVAILIGICALIEMICGFIYLSKGGPEGSGLWSGFGVNNYCYVLGLLSSTVSLFGYRLQSVLFFRWPVSPHKSCHYDIFAYVLKFKLHSVVRILISCTVEFTAKISLICK